jgi:hypothetical protein
MKQGCLKVKQSSYTPWRRLEGEEVWVLLIHDLGTRWGWVVSVTPRPRYSPGEWTPGAHCTGGWVGPRAGLDPEARGKILCPRQGSNPDRPVVQPVVRHYTDWATPAHYPVYEGLLVSDPILFLTNVAYLCWFFLQQFYYESVGHVRIIVVKF